MCLALVTPDQHIPENTQLELTHVIVNKWVPVIDHSEFQKYYCFAIVPLPLGECPPSVWSVFTKKLDHTGMILLRNHSKDRSAGI